MIYSNPNDVCQQFLELVEKLSPNSETYRKLELEKKLIIEVIQMLSNEHSIVKHSYYRDEDSKIGLVNPFFSDHLTKLIHHINFALWKSKKDQVFSDCLFFILKSHCHINLFYRTSIPVYFFPFHALGSVLGRTNYGKYFFIHQNCNVGGNYTEFPIFGDGVVLGPNTSIVGKCKIGHNVKVGAGTLIIEKDIPDNSIIFGRPGNYVVSENKLDNRKIWLDI